MLNVIWGYELIRNFLPLVASKGYGKTGLRFPVIRDHGVLTGVRRWVAQGLIQVVTVRSPRGTFPHMKVVGSAHPPPFSFPAGPPSACARTLPPSAPALHPLHNHQRQVVLRLAAAEGAHGLADGARDLGGEAAPP